MDKIIKVLRAALRALTALLRPARRKERMTMEELTASMIQNGFSVAVAAYLLIRMDRRLEELTKAVTDLGAVMEKTSARHE